jgi:hypothetical protein
VCALSAKTDVKEGCLSKPFLSVAKAWQPSNLLLCTVSDRQLRRMLMNESLLMTPRPTVPLDVQEFAAEKGVSAYLSPLIDLARQAFSSSALCVSLSQDAEDESHRYIAIDVEVGEQPAGEILAAQKTWSAGIRRVCPSRHAVYFVLSWR